MNKDYYNIFGVKKDASQDDIKKAFRKLAHQYHPDKKDGDEKKFKEVNEAYSVLGNEKKRAEYDSYGRVFSGAGGAQGGDFSDFDFSNFAGGFGGGQGGAGFEFDLGDIFSDFFGGGRRRQRRGNDISIDIEVSFEDSVFGTERNVILTKTNLCEKCKGSGGEPGTKMKQCPTCAGKGKIHESSRSFFGSINIQKLCPECAGRGNVPEEKCSNCRGAGVLRSQEEIKIKIPAGIENGEMIRMGGMGEAIKGGEAGDLYIKVHVKKHSDFRKDGNNLIMDLNVKLSDALLGDTYKVKTLDGVIDLKIPQGVNHGDILRVRGKGVPRGSSRGDLLVRVKIDFPKKLSKKAKKLIEDLRGEGI